MQGMKRFDLNLLYAFDALSKTGSVKAAADLLNLSAPAVSHTLARLRETTGDPLLVRAGRKLVPTPRALAMAEVTRELVAQAQAVLAPTVDDQQWMAAEREFVVVVPDELAIAHGVRLLDTVTSRMPNARLKLLPQSDAGADRMRQGTVDVEVRASGSMPPEIKTQALCKQPIVVAMRRSHELSRQKMTLARYAKAGHVFQSQATELDELIERTLAAAQASRRAALRVTTPYCALAAAAQSDLIATVQRSLVEAVAQNLDLVFVPFPLKIEGVRIVQIWHPRLDLDPQHIWLRTCIQSVFGKTNHSDLDGAEMKNAATR